MTAWGTLCMVTGFALTLGALIWPENAIHMLLGALVFLTARLN